MLRPALRPLARPAGTDDLTGSGPDHHQLQAVPGPPRPSESLCGPFSGTGPPSESPSCNRLPGSVCDAGGRGAGPVRHSGHVTFET
jgi:hypothetical protein